MISTHVLDTSRGHPATGVRVTLERIGEAAVIGRGVTNADGRAEVLTGNRAIEPGDYRLTFETGAYFEAQGVESFHPEIVVTFRVSDATENFHVPLLLSPYGYTTYRGS